MILILPHTTVASAAAMVADFVAIVVDTDLRGAHYGSTCTDKHVCVCVSVCVCVGGGVTRYYIELNYTHTFINTLLNSIHA